MRNRRDSLDGSDDAIPASPTRRRVAIVCGLLLALALLAALVWFWAENTERREPGGLFGSRGSLRGPAGNPAAAPARLPAPVRLA